MAWRKRSRRARTTGANEEPEEEEPGISLGEVDGGDVEGMEGVSRLVAIHVCPERPGNIQIGAAAIDCSTGYLCYLGRTIGWEGDFGFLVEMVIALTKPISVVLVSSKMKESHLEVLKSVFNSPLESFSHSAAEKEDKCMSKLIMLPNAMFDYIGACKNIGSRFGMTGALGSVMDLSNRASIQAAGAVLAQAQRCCGDLPPVQFEMFDLGSYLVMDGGSTKALDITKLEEHPSVIRGRGAPKEGFSLLSLLDRSKSLNGHRTLYRWVSRPLTSLLEIHDRHDAVEFLLHRIGHDSLVKINRLLSRVGDVPRSLLRLKTCAAKSNDWLILAESLTCIQLALNELAILRAEVTDMPTLLQNILHSGEAPGLFEVGRALDTIDWESVRGQLTDAGTRVIPLPGVSDIVDKARERLSELPGFLEAETKAIGVPGLTVRCIPVIGFVVAMEENCGIPTNEYEFLFEARKKRQFNSDTGEENEEGEIIRYYKSDRTRFLDSQLGDIPGLVRDVEDEFVRRTEAIVLTYEADLLLAAHRTSELDALCCLTEVAHDFNYCRPVMSSQAVSNIQGARHPLLERVINEKFVPSDIIVEGKCLLITGPNYSGKSVILKTTALIHVLAQIGSFVPAQSACLGVVDRIFTRMSSMETIGAAAVQKESSFSIDVQQIVSILRCCTPNSLILIDEFGKGTNTLDGSALLASVIRYLAEGRAGPTPRCIFATHLVEMFDADLLCVDEITLGEMAVEFEDKAPVPLFRLVIGKRSTGDSYGVACAQRAGVCQTVVNRAAELAERLEKGRPLWRIDERKIQERRQVIENIVNEFMEHQHEATWSDENVDALFSLLR